MKRTALSRRPSKAKREFDAVYNAVLPSILARECEFVRYVAAHSWKTGTYEMTEDGGAFIPAPRGAGPCKGRLVGHHAKGRDLEHPEISNAPENLRCLCDHHHQFVHSHGTWSREVGLMLSRIS